MKKITRTLPSKKRIALVAHDGMKHDLLIWVQRNLSALQNHQLVATSTTAQYLSMNTPLLLDRLSSGPMGGDQQIGARITEGEIDVLVFFWDPRIRINLTSLPYSDWQRYGTFQWPPIRHRPISCLATINWAK